MFSRGRHGPWTDEFNFGDDPDQHPDPDPRVRSPKSAFTKLSKKLPTDFDEILWRAGVWPRDQLITFWWRSASLSGSGSPFRITIRIREELPHCQHTQNRCPAKIIHQFYYAGVRRRSLCSVSTFSLFIYLFILININRAVGAHWRLAAVNVTNRHDVKLSQVKLSRCKLSSQRNKLTIYNSRSSAAAWSVPQITQKWLKH